MSRNSATVLEIPIASNCKDKVPSYLCDGYHQQVFIFKQKGVPQLSDFVPTVFEFRNLKMVFNSSVLVFSVSFFNQKAVLIYVKELSL